MSIRRSAMILSLLLAVGIARPCAAQTPVPPVYNPTNGHWYQAVWVPRGIAWPAARAAAATQSYAGYPGHLATLTSAAETQFVVTQLPLSLDDHWRVGGYQDGTALDYREPAGGWRWITGEPGSYTNWRGGEPNNVGGEDYLEIHSDGTWNDTADQPPGGGYIVEYEPLPGGFSAGQLTLFPNPVVGGQGAVGQLTLPAPAGPGGALVTLFSSNPATAVIPLLVAVPAGASSVTFPVVTFPAATSTTVSISAVGPGVAAATTLQVLPGGPTASNLLINGSFEDPQILNGSAYLTLHPDALPGWRIVRGTVDVHQSWQQAPGQGRQSLGLVGDQAGAVEQSFPTEPGREYLFSGWISHDYGNGVPEGRANVHLNGAFFVQLYHNLPAFEADMRWTPFSYRFRANSARTTLTITDVTGITHLQGTVLDGLVVAPIDGAIPPLFLFAPTGLVAQPISPGQINLAWIDNSPNESGFAIYRRVGSGDWTRIAVVGPNITRYADVDVRSGIGYTYRVQAISDTGGSAWSNEVSVPPLPGAALRLLVSSHNGNSVVRFDGITGTLVDVFVTPGSGGLEGTHGLTIGPDGNLYVCNRYHHSILRYDGRTGAFLNTFVAAGRSSGGLDTPIGLVFGPDGNLYVSSYATNSILRYDGKTGIFIGPFVPSGSGGLVQPYGLKFGPDGNLYVCSLGTSSILRYDGRTGSFIDAFVPPGGGGLDMPKGLIFGPDGNLFVTSSGTNSILRYDGRTGGFLGTLVAPQGGGLTDACGLAFGPDGNLYATSSATNSVLRYDGRTGAFLGIFATGELNSPDWLIFVPSLSPPVAPPTPGPPTAPPAQGPPAAPTNLIARAVSANGVDLVWIDNSSNETAFAVWRKGGGPHTQVTPAPPTDGDWVRIAVLPPNKQTYADTDVRQDTAYSYRVRAIGKAGASGWSNVAAVTTPAVAAPQP